MKSTAFIIVLLTASTNIFAQGGEYISKDDFQKELKKIREVVVANNKSHSELKSLFGQQTKSLDSIEQALMASNYATQQITDANNSTTEKMNDLQVRLEKNNAMATNFLFILVAMLLLFAIASFFVLMRISAKRNKMFKELTDLFSSFSETTEKEVSAITVTLNENKANILSLSNELKVNVGKLNQCLESDRERASMIEEKVKNISFESDIVQKIHLDKIIALQQNVEKTDGDVKQLSSKINDEMLHFTNLFQSEKNLKL